jgi:UDP-N-acetylmuramoylalanine--D-glutamate ligase
MKKRLVILGGAESGVGAAVLAMAKGYNVLVSDKGAINEVHKKVLDDSKIPYEENGHSTEKILQAEEIIKSPGIPESTAIMKAIREREVPVISEIEFAFRYKGDSKIIAITGSNGKTTCTALTYHICKHAGLSCAMVGNIGDSFAARIVSDPKPWYVVEISSFQLDDIKTFRPDVAVLTNITEDHLDRYDYKLENYARSKFRIAENQTAEDVFIYNIDDPETMKYLEQHSIQSQLAPITMSKELPEGVYMTNAEMHIKWKSEEMKMSIEDFVLKGKHNQYNGMAASMASVAVGIRKEKIREALQTFESLPHRMEFVSKVRGISFINDSKATNVNSTWYALESLDQPVILILGGVDKGNDYSALMELVKDKVKALVCMGKDNTKLNEVFADVAPLMINTASAREAVQAAYHFGNSGDAVLLSPACASFDLFLNYEDRGNQFKAAVKEL